MFFTGWKSSQQEQGAGWEMWGWPGNESLPHLSCIREQAQVYQVSVFSPPLQLVLSLLLSELLLTYTPAKAAIQNVWSLDEVLLIILSPTGCRRAENELLWCPQSPDDISIILCPTRLRAHHGGGGRNIVSVRDEGDPLWLCVFWTWQEHHMHELKELWLHPWPAQDQVSQHSTMNEAGAHTP